MRDYRKLAAQRLADMNVLKLELLALHETLQSLRGDLAASNTAGIASQELIKELSARLGTLSEVEQDHQKLNGELRRELEESSTLLKSQRALLKRIKWFLATYPQKGNDARQRASVELIAALEEFDDA